MTIFSLNKFQTNSAKSAKAELVLTLLRLFAVLSFVKYLLEEILCRGANVSYKEEWLKRTQHISQKCIIKYFLSIVKYYLQVWNKCGYGWAEQRKNVVLWLNNENVNTHYRYETRCTVLKAHFYTSIHIPNLLTLTFHCTTYYIRTECLHCTQGWIVYECNSYETRFIKADH